MISSPALASSCEGWLSASIELTDLTPYIDPTDVYGTPSDKGRWLLGEGGEGRVERVKTTQGFHVEKTFSDPLLSSMNADLFDLIETLQIKSFKMIQPLETSVSGHKYPWIKGAPLIKVLENPNVPLSAKEKLWRIYQDKLVQLTEEISSQRPDLFFQINHFASLNSVKERVLPRENLEFIEFGSLGVSNPTKQRPYRQRYLIEIYENEHQDDTFAQVIEPKPDNIVVDLKNWEMIWIDPN